MYNFVPAG